MLELGGEWPSPEEVEKAEKRAEERGEEWLRGERQRMDAEFPLWREIAGVCVGVGGSVFFFMWALRDATGLFWPIPLTLGIMTLIVSVVLVCAVIQRLWRKMKVTSERIHNIP
jgi:hypothetical protein